MSNNNQRRFADKPSNKMSYSAGSNANLSQYTPTAPEYDSAGHTAEPKTKKKHKTMADRKLKATGLVLMALFAVSIFLAPSSTSVNTSEEAVQAVESGMSTQLPTNTLTIVRKSQKAPQKNRKSPRKRLTFRGGD